MPPFGVQLLCSVGPGPLGRSGFGLLPTVQDLTGDEFGSHCCGTRVLPLAGRGSALQRSLFLLSGRILYRTCSTCTLRLVLALLNLRYRKYISSRPGSDTRSKGNRAFQGKCRYLTGGEARQARDWSPVGIASARLFSSPLVSIDLCPFDRLLRYG